MNNASQSSNLDCSSLVGSLPITSASFDNPNTPQYEQPHNVMIYHTFTEDALFNAQGLQTDSERIAAIYSNNSSPKSPPAVAPRSLAYQQQLPQQVPVFQYPWPQLQPEMQYFHQSTGLAASDVVSQIEGHYMNTSTSGPQQTLYFGSLEMSRLKALQLCSSGPVDTYSSGTSNLTRTGPAKMILPSSETTSFSTYCPSDQLPSSYQFNMFDAPTLAYGPLQHESIYRSPEFDGLSSPEVISPASEHSLFGVSDEDSYFSFVPGTMQTPHSLPFEHMNFASGALNPAPSMVFIPPLARISHSSSNVQYFPEASLPLGPLQPSSAGTHGDSLAETDPAVESSNEVVESTSRRRNRAPKSRPRNKILIKYACPQADCDVVCSSLPSLSRHMHSHKWKGKYPPIRCGSCNRELSNEYSAQRHIMRSPETSSCKRLRSYNIMRSMTAIDFTVRFYPKRPHGKKTVRIELAYARRRYLGHP